MKEAMKQDKLFTTPQLIKGRGKAMYLESEVLKIQCKTEDA
jgi:hypothetical protein